MSPIFISLTFSLNSRSYMQLFDISLWVDVNTPQGVLVVKNLPANAGDLRDTGLIPVSERSPGVGHGNPLQYSYLENPTTEKPGGIQSIGSQRIGHD